MKRRKFNREFKLNVLSELEAGKTIAQISSEKSISPGLISKWKAEYKTNPHLAFSGRGNISSLESELNECKRVIGELYLQIDFLKKVQKNLQNSLIHQRLKKLEDSTK
jgi:transposase